MAKKRPRGFLWWWHVLVVMTAITWGTFVYFALVPPEHKPWFLPYTFGLDSAADESSLYDLQYEH